MLHAFLTWVLVVAFAAAGVMNAVGSPPTRESFVRWGYPAWWCWVTGATELLVAALAAWPPTRAAGLTLGGLVIAVAVITVSRHREFLHLAPLALLGLVTVGVVRTLMLS